MRSRGGEGRGGSKKWVGRAGEAKEEHTKGTSGGGRMGGEVRKRGMARRRKKTKSEGKKQVQRKTYEKGEQSS